MNNDLYSLFLKMDLTPGCSTQDVNDRYKSLAFLLHPDQITGDRKKELAEKEMKAINNRRDLIISHLKSAAHKVVGNCECRFPEAFWRSFKQTEQATTKHAEQSNTTKQSSNNGTGGQFGQSDRARTQGDFRQPDQSAQSGNRSRTSQNNGPDRQHQTSNKSKAGRSSSEENIRPTNFSSKTTRERLRKAGIWPDCQTEQGGTASGAQNFKDTKQSENTTQFPRSNGAQNLQNLFNFMAGLLFFGSTLAIAAGGEALAKNQQKLTNFPRGLTQSSVPPIIPRTFTSCSLERLPLTYACTQITGIPETYVLKPAELGEISSSQMASQTTALDEEFKQLLSQLQSPEAFSQNELAGRIPTLYKRFNFVDNQKTIFENELRRRGINWKKS